MIVGRVMSEADAGAAMIEGAIAGDEVAFAEIVAAHHEDMARIAYLVSGSPDVGGDAVQGAWAIAWQRLTTLDDAARLRPWLMSVAASEAHRMTRGDRRRTVRELRVQAPGPAPPTPAQAAQIDLANALARLDSGDRALIALRYVADLDSAAIGREMGLSAPGVRVRLDRLIGRLREDLDDAEATPTDPFEQRLAGLVRIYTEPASVPVDHLAIARAAMASRARRQAPLARARRRAIGRRLLPVLAVSGVVVAVLAVTLTGRSTPLKPVDTTPRLAFVRDGDLFVSAIDGTGATMIRGGGADGTSLGYLAVLWSPDMRSIAAVRDTGGPVLEPVIDILEPDGTVQRTIDTGPGGTPSVSWSPDSMELAITTYPGEVDRDATEPIDARPRLTIAARDGGSHEIPLPPNITAYAGAGPDLWTVPDLGVRWSPDGRWIAVAWDDPWGRYHMVAADGSGVAESDGETGDRCGSTRNFIDWFPDGCRMATIGAWADVSALCVETVGRNGLPDGPALTVAEAEANASGTHQKFLMPAVSPGGDRIAISTWNDDFDHGRHASTLRVYDLASGQATDVASGVQALVIEASGEAHWTDTLEGDPVWMGGFAWTGDGRQLLYLSPEPGDRPTRWTIRAVDAAGGSPSSAVVEGVRSFDVGFAH
jgi:RNA polymerase sigma-70 factor (ECF subfamily)